MKDTPKILAIAMNPTPDAKMTDARYIDIVANSGQPMEDGVTFPVEDFHVVNAECELIPIKTLARDPEAQTENYIVNALCDHEDETVRSKFGICKVWLADGVLYARVYFASNDTLADHCYSIASISGYSVGVWLYPEYHRNGIDTDQPLGILREISMVNTPRDPRSIPIAERAIIKPVKGDNLMTKDETETDVTKEEAREEAKEEPVRSRKASLITSPQSDEDVWREFASIVYKAGGVNRQAKEEWRNYRNQTATVSGNPDPTPVDGVFLDTLKRSQGIISRFRNFEGVRAYRAKAWTADQTQDTGRAKGHVKGQNKADQTVTIKSRDILCKMVYKRLDLDAMEMWEDPALARIRVEELSRAIIVEYERAAIIGDGRTAGETADYRLFDGASRGFFSILSDVTNSSSSDNFAAYVADELDYSSETYSDYLLQTAVRAGRYLITAPYDSLYLVVKSAIAQAMDTARDSTGRPLVEKPLNEYLGVSDVYTPFWFTDDTSEEYDAFLIADNAYALIGESSFTTRDTFDTTTNTAIQVVESPRGGSLITDGVSAVGIKLPAKS